ncbi:rRNA methyltransferase 1, mitochondrial [Notolabrus celidotus]|uniref:rRNA methyltransferase 1, mitochondrial n=1 Tax=Notolabrus celidotus TaxID=1203425 RepID=UPI0014901B1A|nr:rRNA methyltransferase 1, mitochondrial [Notolabrus celidotus]
MWVSSFQHPNRLLFVCSKSLPSRLGSQFACYHVTASLWHSKDRSSFKPEGKRARRESDGGQDLERSVQSTAEGKRARRESDGRQDRERSVQSKAEGKRARRESDGRQDRERSVQSKAWKNEIPILQRPDQRRRDDRRVSPELRKLCLEDFHPDRERPLRQKTALDSKSEDCEVVFGISPCLLALTQGRRKAKKLFVKDGEAFHRESVIKVCEEAHKRGVQVHRVSRKDLDKMSAGRVHQGVCLQASPLSYLTETRDSAPRGKPSTPPLWLVLEKIQDPMNLGAILRSAYFLGVDRVVSSLHHSCPLSPVVSKASSGVMEVMELYGCDNLEETLRSKATQGWEVVGTVGAEAEQSQVSVTKCSDFQMTRPTLLLMGGEGEGLSKELLSLCQTLLTIPAGRDLFPGVESLNVSVAAGILLHTLLFSRSSSR